MSERNKKIGLGKKGLPDMVLSILKALGSCSPATAPLASLLSDFQNQKQYQLIEDTLSKFSTYSSFCRMRHSSKFCYSCVFLDSNVSGHKLMVENAQ